MRRRLIEGGFPVREASLDSVHEKNVRQGHISTQHIWPARRPLAACRAALLATLLPDPGTEEGRRELRERIGGRLMETPGKDGRMREVTAGGIVHWGQEETRGRAGERRTAAGSWPSASTSVPPSSGTRRELRARTEPDEAALGEIRVEQAAVAAGRAAALRELAEAPDRILPGEARLLAHALVIPAPDSAEVERYRESVEEMAVRIASEWERERGGHLEDVSKPEKARAVGLPDWPGFDLLSIRPDGEKRHIEVKGRTGQGSVGIEANEWKQAFHMGADYWLHVVLDCGTPNPTLVRVRDPARRLLASHRISESFSISAGALREAAETE